MPHLVLYYSGNLDAHTDMTGLCRALADTMIAQRDDEGRAVFPLGGTRVLAYPAAHWALADGGEAGRAAGGTGEYAFIYLNLRMGAGRSASVHRRVGEALEATAVAHLRPVMDRLPTGVTLQIDEGPEVFDAKNSTLHPLFRKP